MDEGVYECWTVPNDYDPLLSKLIAWGNSREETILRLRRALDEYVITGIQTNAGLFRRLLEEPEFLRGEIHTRWLDELLGRPPAASGAWAGHGADVESSAEAAAMAAAVWQAKQDAAAAPGTTSAAETASRWKMEGRRELLDRRP